MADVVRFGAEFDSRNMVRGISAADRRLRGLNQTAGRNVKAINAMKVAFLGFLSIHAARRLAGIGVELFKLGAAALATRSRFEITFGDAAASIEAFRNEWQQISGLSTREFDDLASRGAAVTQGMGAATEASAAFSEQILKLGGDLASFNDLPTPAAVDAIIASLTGENEKLKRFNIIINEVNTQQRALANTSKETAAELTLLDKATAKLQLITEFAGVAMGDLERTAQDTDNIVKQLGASWRSLNEKLGSFLAESPLVKDVLVELRDLFQNLTTILSGQADEIKNTFADLGQLAGVVFTGAFLEVSAQIPSLIRLTILDAIPAIGDEMNAVLDRIDLFKKGGDALGNIFLAQVEPILDRLEERATEIQRRTGFVGPPVPGRGGGADGGGGGGGAGTGAGVDITFGEVQQPFVALEALAQMDQAFRDIAIRAELLGETFDGSAAQADVLRDTMELLMATGLDPNSDTIQQLAAQYRALSDVQGDNIDAVNEMADAAEMGFAGMTGAFEDFVGRGLRGLDDLGEAITRMLQRMAAEALVSRASAALGIPGFQSGGVVPGPIGAPQLAVVHGGETVIPAHQSAGPTVSQTINFNVTANDAQSVQQFFAANKGEIARVVAEAAQDSSSFQRMLGGR